MFVSFQFDPLPGGATVLHPVLGYSIVFVSAPTAAFAVEELLSKS